MIESEMWFLVKKLCINCNLNPFDLFVFIQKEIRKMEKLIQRHLSNKEIRKMIFCSIFYLNSKNHQK